MSAVLREPELFGVLRVPPHNTDAEAQVLGAMLFDPNCIETVSTMLRTEDFYRREHREIFDAVMRQSGKGRPTDAVTLGDLLPEHRGLLVEIAREAYTAANVKGYAGMVRDKALRRSLIDDLRETQRLRPRYANTHARRRSGIAREFHRWRGRRRPTRSPAVRVSGPVRCPDRQRLPSGGRSWLPLRGAGHRPALSTDAGGHPDR